MELHQESLGFLLADVSRLMRRAFKQQLEGSALTLAQARALIYVSLHEGVRQIDLADMLEVQAITLARLIDKLVEAGVVERRPDPVDRRAYQIYLTTAAAPHLVAIEQVAAKIRADALRGLSEQQAASVILALRQMRDNFASS
ncbi:MAG: MarR family transcriptional regulator [Burkholderiaceae bacterium]|nr:MarR family transcriptional regulator [Burkholderiaceae bacterium]